MAPFSIVKYLNVLEKAGSGGLSRSISDSVHALSLECTEEVLDDWTLLQKVEASCDRYLIAGGTNVEAEWEQGPAI